jgi:hypothetical protein
MLLAALVIREMPLLSIPLATGTALGGGALLLFYAATGTFDALIPHALRAPAGGDGDSARTLATMRQFLVRD